MRWAPEKHPKLLFRCWRWTGRILPPQQTLLSFLNCLCKWLLRVCKYLFVGFNAPSLNMQMIDRIHSLAEGWLCWLFHSLSDSFSLYFFVFIYLFVMPPMPRISTAVFEIACWSLHPLLILVCPWSFWPALDSRWKSLLAHFPSLVHIFVSAKAWVQIEFTVRVEKIWRDVIWGGMIGVAPATHRWNGEMRGVRLIWPFLSPHSRSDQELWWKRPVLPFIATMSITPAGQSYCCSSRLYSI